MTTRPTLHDLTESQQRAPAVLIDGGTVTAAAKAAGVSRQTVSAWRNQDSLFMAALNAVARDQLRYTHDSLRALAPAAVNILAQELAAGSETASKAARDVLRMLERMGSDMIGSASPTVVKAQLEDEEERALLASLAQMMKPADDEDEDDALAWRYPQLA